MARRPRRRGWDDVDKTDIRVDLVSIGQLSVNTGRRRRPGGTCEQRVEQPRETGRTGPGRLLLASHHGRIERVNEHLRIGALDHIGQRTDVVCMVVCDDDLAQVIRLAADALDLGEDAVGAAGDASIDQRQPVGLLVEVRSAEAEAIDGVDAGDDLHALPPGAVCRRSTALGRRTLPVE